MNEATSDNTARLWQDITVVDNFLPGAEQSAIYHTLSNGAWTHGWRSRSGEGAQPFWHQHFVGPKGSLQTGQEEQGEEKLARDAPLLHAFWGRLSTSYLSAHDLHSCYANGLPYGTDGALHTDSLAPGACTAVYYPHTEWDPDWGGETILFNEQKDDILAAIYPKPNRLLIFPGFVHHVARGVSRTCPVMRITLMFKTQINAASIR
ncbi:2OG-Fe(II) oxygenase [Burkholderia sp. FERM BP-3421]|uniref:2OG-Fe(II) oxygenase n=1 Tax=Burkholderia sp. FERM BP-3421 TaxID=1494466 RepID=UPI00235DD5B5|nr:2OG-Fe(II) oxygenase [Burkholderia sp. FERM BP-3421]WDD92027.1 2OG-Fe(II) oxygenase [Burkholderia sp. FERM BP-3421]